MAGKSDHSFMQRTTKNIASGTIGGIVNCLVGHPFDTLKVRLQTQPVHNPVYNGLVDCFMKTMKWEGIGGLYKGVGSPLVGQMVFRATLFSSFYQVCSWLGQADRPGHRLTTPEYFLGGFYTGLCASFVETPIDLFKTKLQIQIIRAQSGHPQQYKNVFQAGYQISKTYGVKGAYQGLGATLLRNGPSYSIAFGVLEGTRNYFIPEGGTSRDVSNAVHLFAGGAGGFMYWVFTYPTDVIKSSMQSDHSDPKERKFKNIVNCAKRLYVEEGGWRRFYRGYLPCMMRSLPANAAMFTVVEKVRERFP
ncbi:hypothetical protein CAPTEDRAFT_167531 [Capitella teleta]|uniref:Mitochondrial carrier protein n=1 Tax=Capitella teleta TaxID=283909 RepID=X1ZB32_CAPTE|nr:hypothetical protein CAPTEDRAFT_167531 [Capitella teleta]|eukprot:ELU10091.1 hypothetical protein CAPTEDRAFT_167531 [Capitella teleta]